MKALTARQQEVFDLIRDHISQTGMPPTRAEIAQRLGFRSPNAAEEHLKALARKGVIEIVSGASRGIRLLQEEEEGLPLVVVWLPVNRFWRNSILKVIIRSILPCSSRMLISCCASAGCR
ncbi:LexA repressor [Escherichia coli]|uniref:LexA repressor n=1 Tax=Escherichia coli TaxID=562 RepID=A0A376L6E1_ECOLX|nr:LexA repressor [Escherichia coli]